MKQIDFTDHTILITGATGHLGRAFCLAAAKMNARIILIDQHASDLTEFQDELITINKLEHQSYCIDLGVQSERADCIDAVLASGVMIDSLINNAAFTGVTDLKGWNTSFEHQSASVFNDAIEVNLTSAFEFSQKLSSIIRHSKNGSILNVASIYANLAPDYSLYEDTSMQNPAAYGVSKAGLLQLTRWLSTTLAPSIRVNAISPGGIYREQNQVFVDRYVKKTSLGRMAHESDIVDPMLFLISTMSRYITGQTIIVDGGYSSF